MKKGLLAAWLGTCLLSATTVLAEDVKAKKSSGHCEKTDTDGKTEDIEAADKADCKAKGGKWNKAAKGEHQGHEHKEGDGHEHK